jgi:exopolysaccharide biosynthesis polyprenyl glycosylphosphotransferase
VAQRRCAPCRLLLESAGAVITQPMLRRDRLIRMQVHQLMDACLFAISFWLAFTLRANPNIIDLFGLEPVDHLNPFESYVWLYLILIPAGPLVLEAQGFYSRPIISSRRTAAWQLLKGCVILTLGVVLCLFLARMVVARNVVIWFGVISFLLVSLKEEVLHLVMSSPLARAQYRRRFILAGRPDERGRLRAELRTVSEGTIEIVGELDLTNSPVERLVELLHTHSVNGVILSANYAYFEQIEAAVRACELEGVETWLVADFFKTQISRTSFDEFHGRPVLVFRSTPETSWQAIAKQVLDFVVALVSLIVLAIPFAIIALLIKITSPGPVFFRQQRAGLNGQPFTIYKFRSMVTNAEQLKQELAALNEMSGPVFKVSNDPRITPIGKFLRKFSVDEFPQLFNVLRGEMSLVGPRPLPVDEVSRFDDCAHRRRLSVKPGLTCLWQVRGRSNLCDFKEWVRLDLEYIDNWSLWLDLRILARTVPIVLTGAGAK